MTLWFLLSAVSVFLIIVLFAHLPTAWVTRLLRLGVKLRLTEPWLAELHDTVFTSEDHIYFYRTECRTPDDNRPPITPEDIRRSQYASAFPGETLFQTETHNEILSILCEMASKLLLGKYKGYNGVATTTMLGAKGIGKFRHQHAAGLSNDARISYPGSSRSMNCRLLSLCNAESPAPPHQHRQLHFHAHP